MKQHILRVGAAAWLFAVGCGPETLEEDSDADSLVARNGIEYWTVHGSVVPACWETPGFAREKRIIANAIENTWGRAAYLKFTWTECPTSGEARHVRIRINAEAPVTDANGNVISYPSGGSCPVGAKDSLHRASDGTTMNISFVPNNVTTGRLEYLAVHEMGHALGFDHEQLRRDNNDTYVGNGSNEVSCRNDRSDNITYLTSFHDRASVMHYCNWNGNNLGDLSNGDVIGVRSVYGRRVPSIMPRPHDSSAVAAENQSSLTVLRVDSGGWPRRSDWSSSRDDGVWQRRFLSGLREDQRSLSLAPGASITALSRIPGHVDAFVVDTRGALLTSFYDLGQNRWSNWFALTADGALPASANLSAVSRHPSHIDVFAIGFSGEVLTTYWDLAYEEGRRWSPLFPISRSKVGMPGGALATVSRLDNHVDVFTVSQDGAIQSLYWDTNFYAGTRWSDAQPITPSYVFPAGAPLSALSRVWNHVDLFGVSNWGNVFSIYWDTNYYAGTRWSDLAPLTGYVAAPGASITAVSRAENHVDIFFPGARGEVFSTYWDTNYYAGTRWAPEVPILPAGSVSPSARIAAVSRVPEQVDFYAIDPTGDRVIGAWWHVQSPSWSDHVSLLP